MAQYKKSTSKRSTSSKKNSRNKVQDDFNEDLVNEIVIIIVVAVALCLFLCNFGILGKVGNFISDFMFGLFGLMAYVFPLLGAYLIFFGMANAGNSKAVRRNVALILLFVDLGMAFELIFNKPDIELPYSLKDIYGFASTNHKGGGILSGSLAYLSVKGLGIVGTVLLILVLAIICLVLITEKSFFGGVRRISDGSIKAVERSANQAYAHSQERSEARRIRAEEKRIQKEEEENNKILRNKEVSGVPTYNFVPEEIPSKERDDIHEINLNIDEDALIHEEIKIHGLDQSEEEALVSDADAPLPIAKAAPKKEPAPAPLSMPLKDEIRPVEKAVSTPVRTQKTSNKKYQFPPIELLKALKSAKKGDKQELMDTARKLEEVLESFNVKAKVTDVSQGPTVTRYEMIPETGVKVSRILSLSDDLKLNLAAADIRIEAPIPGKAAIGIEVPNKESSAVSLRELIDSKEFKSSESTISFAVGKDLAGKVVVADIAKMPHMLIAGATGSGKSVCINTLIMSIIYKARPDEVKMIMIDPKVVELSVYNGIPHLLIPVVTDPKKANASLAWAVKEMEERYHKFSEWGVRDIKGYNERIDGEKDENGGSIPKMFKLVVIVDELADLMMVAGKEVEESICRLAQLARAAGIHLIIATQRPSVDVITGLIKANMPSRIAFSVSSGVDSRTILDMVGAEKLLGKGDMLFYPQGYTKPARIQGAFVSDNEVADIVRFLKDNSSAEDNNHDIMEKIQNMTSDSSNKKDFGGSSDDNADELFYQAGKFITESGKSTIGMLQREFKIGFNRAARIMDSLAEAGVVGPEEGKKPRVILMTPEEFEDFMSNY